ncbi:hypothetical protein KFK09_022319 [Dendrobium nobile]|uniref:Reverse transcriptase zinc-binding domain-containing protein n=1 Tax=Dendrobium nobile TaxID=94219 RepID=A0A8T3AJS4_DENNO|nr:hypothetical protein KFK09_022319 [Dendrobium nobile]
MILLLILMLMILLFLNSLKMVNSISKKLGIILEVKKILVPFNKNPLFASILTWRILKGCIPVDSRLQNNAIQLVSRCQCCSQIVTLNHVFLYSPLAINICYDFENGLDIHVLQNNDNFPFLGYMFS